METGAGRQQLAQGVQQVTVEQGSLVPAERKSEEGPEVQGSESESQRSDTTFRCD